MGLQISLSTAERIKPENGGVVATGLDDREMIEIASETGDWELDRRIISRSDLIGIIRPRLKKFLEEAIALALFCQVKNYRWGCQSGTWYR